MTRNHPMRSKRTLYVKNPATKRYEEYKPDYSDCLNTLYRRLPNGRYEPTSLLRSGSICEYPEGVYAVTRTSSGASMTNGTYLRDLLQCEHCSELRELPLSRLATPHKAAEYVIGKMGAMNTQTVARWATTTSSTPSSGMCTIMIYNFKNNKLTQIRR